MNRPSLIQEIAQKTKIEPEAVERVLLAFEETVKNTLQNGEKITLMGFGVFLAKKRESRRAANPLNPEETILVPTVTVVKFRPGQYLKEAVKNSTM